MLADLVRSIRVASLGLLLSLLASCGGGESGSAVSSSGSTSGAAIATIRLTPETKQIAVGESTTFTAEAFDAAGMPLAGRTFAMASVNTAIASAAGLSANVVQVTGVAQGVVNVIATAEGKEGKAIVTVGGFAPIQVSGQVIDGETLQPLAGAQVTALQPSEGPAGGPFATTATDGGFTMAIANPANREALWEFTATLTGYQSTTLFASVRPPNQFLEPLLIVKPRAAPGSITGGVKNARDNTAIPNTPVGLFRGQGLTIGSVATTTTDAQGGFSFVGLPAGVYTLSALPEKFSSCSRTVVSLESSRSATQNLFCSPSATSNDLATRIVLTWGNSPADLDAHLTGPNAADANRFHVYYLNSRRGSLDANPFALLDTDERGGLGPETITIKRFNSGVYRFSVHDYSNRDAATSSALGNSRAKVELYLPGALDPQVFNVPVQRGNLWTVFELVGTPGDATNIRVTPRNDMAVVADEEAIQ